MCPGLRVGVPAAHSCRDLVYGWPNGTTASYHECLVAVIWFLNDMMPQLWTNFGNDLRDQAKGITDGQMLVRIMQSAQLISEHVGYTEHVFNHHAHTNAISRAMIASWSVRHLKWCTMVNIATLSPRTVMLERLSFTCSNQTLNAVKHSRTCCPLGEPRGIWKICSSSAVFLGRKMSKSHH